MSKSQIVNKENLTWDMRKRLQSSRARTYLSTVNRIITEVLNSGNDLALQDLWDGINTAEAGDGDFIFPKLFNSERWEKSEPYEPTLAGGTSLFIPFDNLTLESSLFNCYIQNETHVRVTRAGRYKINAKWLVVPQLATDIAWTMAELNLWKNGSKYSNLKTKMLIVPNIVLGSNFHFPFVDLTGQDFIDLTIDDYFEIEFIYQQETGGIPLGTGDLHGGRFNINYYDNTNYTGEM